MKTKAWGAVVMVAFAWVLWNHLMSSSHNEWRIVGDGFNKKSECTNKRSKKLEKEFKSAKKRYPATNKVLPYGEYGFVQYLKNVTISSEYHCLPAIIDPRPRK